METDDRRPFHLAKATEGESLLAVSVFSVIYKAKSATDQRRGKSVFKVSERRGGVGK